MPSPSRSAVPRTTDPSSRATVVVPEVVVAVPTKPLVALSRVAVVAAPREAVAVPPLAAVVVPRLPKRFLRHGLKQQA